MAATQRGFPNTSGCGGAAAAEVEEAAAPLTVPEPKLAVPHKGNRETFIGFSIGIFNNNRLIINRDSLRILNRNY